MTNGIILSDDIHEIVAPAGGTVLEKVVPVTNKHLGAIVVNKTGTFDSVSQKWDGATFVAFPKRATSGNTEADMLADRTAAGSNVKTLLRTALGTYKVDGLVPGDYWLVEDVAPEGFAKGNPYYRVVSVQSGANYTGFTSAPTTVDNAADMGKVTIKKVDSTDATKFLEATFELYLK
ncbi:hypothetical protein LJB83_03085, partial [Clostridia bacterium OttesenSCG-928-F22]|nr:hypothetical protein [Clostridia bacterium OttesenSCG-928-F22]